MTPREELEALRQSQGSLQTPREELEALRKAQVTPRAPPPPPEPINPAEGMSFGEKALVGAGGGLRRMYLGGKGIFTENTPEEKQELEDWKKNKEHLGFAGTLGELGAEAVATAPIGGPVAGGTAKVLTKALPWLEKVGKYGGRFLNLGTAGRAGTEAAVAGAIAPPEEGESRLGNAATAGLTTAGVLGAAVPATKLTKAVARSVLPTAGNAAVRAGQTFEKYFDPERLAGIESKVRNAPPSRLPQTTAAIADDPGFGAIERGARARNTAGFTEHDTEVAKQTYNNLLNDTATAKSPEQYAARAKKLQDAGNRVLDTVRVDDGARNILRGEIEQILNSNEIWTDTAKKNAISKVLGILEVPNLSARGLKQAHDKLSMLSGEGIDAAKESLRYVGDSLTDDTFSYIDKVAAKSTAKGEEAAAARAVKEAFVSREGMPVTGKVYQGDVPKIEAAPLRKTIAKHEAALSPQRRGDLANIAEELRRHEIYNPVADTGGTAVDIGSVKGPVTRGVSVSPAWKLRPLAEIATKWSDEKAQKVFDEAVKDPQKFLSLMTTKQLRQQPLSQTEQLIQSMLMNAPARQVGAAQGD